MKRVCNGSRDEVDLMFRMEKGDSKSKSNRSGRLQKIGSHSTPFIQGPHSHDLPDRQWRMNPRYEHPGISRSLFPSQDDQILCYFYDFIIRTMPESDHSRYLHQQLLALLSRSRQDSALYLAAQAISQAIVCHFSIGICTGSVKPRDYQSAETLGTFRCVSSQPFRPLSNNY